MCYSSNACLMESFISRWWWYIWQQDSVGDISSKPNTLVAIIIQEHDTRRCNDCTGSRSSDRCLVSISSFIQKELLGNNWFDEPNLLKGADWTCLYLCLHPSLLRSHPGGVKWPACVPMSCTSMSSALSRSVTVTRLAVTPHDKLPPPAGTLISGDVWTQVISRRCLFNQTFGDVPQL